MICIKRKWPPFSRQNLDVSNHSVTCKLCSKKYSNKCVGGLWGGDRVCMCGIVCVGGVVGCEGVSEGVY